MEKKERILKKIHLKDYTHKLEKVLEEKSYSVQVKNLLLSMFYKIENAYNDYQKTKVDVSDKGEFFEKLINIIKNDCIEIEIQKFENENTSKNNKYELENQKISTLANEFTMLNAILEIDQKEIILPQEEELLKKPITSFLNLGIKMNEAEVIRDFNGWSWDLVTKEVQNVETNLVFQTLLYLLGYSFILEWAQNESDLADYLMLAYENLKQNYDEKVAKQIIKLFCKLVIDMEMTRDEACQKFWREYKEENEKELEKLSNKEEYINNVTEQKKELTKQIENIDKMLNNKEELKKEYELRNEKLPNKEKIFSIRHLVNRLEIERQEYVDKIKNCNILLDPKGYVARKREYEKKVSFLRILNLDNKNLGKGLLQLCLLFLKCMKIKIEKAQTRQEVIEFFYIIRYYRFLSFDKEGTTLKEIPKLTAGFEEVILGLLQKASKMAIIDYITKDEEVNYQILHKIFDSKMIDLNNTVIESNVQDGKLFATFYDGNIIENTYEIYSKKTVKLKKKVKLFI